MRGKWGGGGGKWGGGVTECYWRVNEMCLLCQSWGPGREESLKMSHVKLGN